MKFPKRLTYLRRRAGLTQEKLAELICISRPTVSLYESGKREPNLETLTRIADLFNVSVDYLIGRADLTLQSDTLGLYYQVNKFLTPEVVDEILSFYSYLIEKTLEEWNLNKANPLKDGDSKAMGLKPKRQ